MPSMVPCGFFPSCHSFPTLSILSPSLVAHACAFVFHYSPRYFDIFYVSLACVMEHEKRQLDQSFPNDDNSKKQKTESKISTSLF